MFDVLLMAIIFECFAAEVFVTVCEKSFDVKSGGYQIPEESDYCCTSVRCCWECPNVSGMVVYEDLDILMSRFVSGGSHNYGVDSNDIQWLEVGVRDDVFPGGRLMSIL